jgi:hypothetical protein
MALTVQKTKKRNQEIKSRLWNALLSSSSTVSRNIPYDKLCRLVFPDGDAGDSWLTGGMGDSTLTGGRGVPLRWVELYTAKAKFPSIATILPIRI